MKTTNNHMAVRIQVMIPALLLLMLFCDQYELSSASDKPLLGTVWKLEGFGADNGTLTALLFQYGILAIPSCDRRYFFPGKKWYGRCRKCPDSRYSG